MNHHFCYKQPKRSSTSGETFRTNLDNNITTINLSTSVPELSSIVAIMTDKMRTPQLSHSSLNHPIYQNSETIGFIIGGIALISSVLYSLSITLPSTQVSPISIEKALGYALILIGYLLLPGVGVLLVRRKRCLARTASLLEQTTDVHDQILAQELSALPAVPTHDASIMKDIDQSSKCLISHSDSEDDIQCTVCLAELQNGDKVRQLDCGHMFHKQCADLWLLIGKKNRCPLCMASVCSTRDENMKLLKT